MIYRTDSTGNAAGLSLVEQKKRQWAREKGESARVATPARTHLKPRRSAAASRRGKRPPGRSVHVADAPPAAHELDDRPQSRRRPGGAAHLHPDVLLAGGSVRWGGCAAGVTGQRLRRRRSRELRWRPELR